MPKILPKFYDCEFLFFQTTKSKAKLNHYFFQKMINQQYNTILHVYKLKYYNTSQIYKDFGNLYLNFFHYMKFSLYKLTYF